MRIGVPLSLIPKNQNGAAVLGISYQASMLSLIKYGLSNSNPVLFQELYSGNHIKNFATSVFFPHAQFVEKRIILSGEQNAILYFSTNDIQLGLNYFNAFQWLRSKGSFSFNKNLDVKLGKIFNVPLSTITSHRAVFKTMSPLVVRSKDGYFLSCSRNKLPEEFQHALIESVKLRQNGNSMQQLADNLEFKPIKMRKTVMDPFGQYIEASTGLFELSASPLLLNEILNSGLGSKRGSFAGMIGLVKEVSE